jgi:hypothetical protein
MRRTACLCPRFGEIWGLGRKQKQLAKLPRRLSRQARRCQPDRRGGPLPHARLPTLVARRPNSIANGYIDRGNAPLPAAAPPGAARGARACSCRVPIACSCLREAPPRSSRPRWRHHLRRHAAGARARAGGCAAAPAAAGLLLRRPLTRCAAAPQAPAPRTCRARRSGQRCSCPAARAGRPRCSCRSSRPSSCRPRGWRRRVSRAPPALQPARPLRLAPAAALLPGPGPARHPPAARPARRRAGLRPRQAPGAGGAGAGPPPHPRVARAGALHRPAAREGARRGGAARRRAWRPAGGRQGAGAAGAGRWGRHARRRVAQPAVVARTGAGLLG